MRWCRLKQLQSHFGGGLSSVEEGSRGARSILGALPGGLGWQHVNLTPLGVRALGSARPRVAHGAKPRLGTVAASRERPGVVTGEHAARSAGNQPLGVKAGGRWVGGSELRWGSGGEADPSA